MTGRVDIAERVAAVINADGAAEAQVWTGGDRVRVYVSRRLSRGRQEMGHITVRDDGTLDEHLTRARAGIMRIAEGALDA